jgi:hypothetical protein
VQALLDVFDTDQDGKLDAGDANFSKFKLMVHLPRQQSISTDFGAYTVNSSPAAVTIGDTVRGAQFKAAIRIRASAKAYKAAAIELSGTSRE